VRVGDWLEISKINEETYGQIMETYASVCPEFVANLEAVAVEEIYRVLTKKSQIVIHDSLWNGFLILFQKDERATINPWIFSGIPVTAEANVELKNELLRTTLQYCKSNGIKSLISVQNHNTLKDHNLFVDSGFIYDYDYCDMELELNKVDLDARIRHQKTLSTHTEIKNINDTSLAEIKQVYHQSFQASDAKFYQEQTMEEKVDFFNFLGYFKALDEPCSICVYDDDQLVGFTFLIESDEDDSRHISCMCVSPEYFGRGFGALMLDDIIINLKKQQVKKIILGTETQMKAFKLYQSRGFMVTGTSSYYHMFID